MNLSSDSLEFRLRMAEMFRRGFLVYLAGPISGLTYNDAVDWRGYATKRLGQTSNGRIETLSPMRHKEYLAAAGKAGDTKIADSYEEHVMSSQRGIFYRDFLDCTRADLVLVNMLGATDKSLGTTMEIAWAYQARVPVVLAMEKAASNPHEHSMLREACGFRVATLDEALSVTYQILMPDGWGALA